ncbi:sulfotransferase family protein [Thermomonospora cellulosilytica]|uniref:LPS sulfotransferase NodH n=1 Tax=Thermomonospora cellulosilytica TaxID=1411118 RepID=A0A7W3RAU8_9ACTN|nr:sulfotransferase [Thermomonospora cellulosilytica]MBA9006793.1 LPS sulfotransferase NodH [Thermomonospora cellulosilytica]
MQRLLSRPVFLLSSVRSGSTLLRAMLNRHSLLYAPHELHLRDVRVTLEHPLAGLSMAELGLDETRLEYLLWDRLMHDLLRRSGKRVFVNKTPTDVFIWERIAECWPDARFVFLVRHPGAIARSWARAQVHWTFDEAVTDVHRYAAALQRARRALPGPTVAYEELTADPAAVLRCVCDHLEVPWEPEMLAYRRDGYVRGLGDWSDKIRSGRPLPAPPPPAAIPGPLRAIAEAWGYAPAARPAGGGSGGSSPHGERA